MQDIITFISTHPELCAAMGFALLLLIIVEFLRNKRRHFQVSPLEMTQLINHNNAVVIDIRSNEVFKNGHVIDAVSLPAKDVMAPKKLDKYKAKPIILVCQTGNDSQKIAASLLKGGYNVHSLAGGMRAWIDAQMPLVKE